MKKDITTKMTINVPEFDAIFEGDQRQFRIAITDHDPIIIDTACGFLASLNIWCPGSPIAPNLNPTTAKGVLTVKSQQDQMKLMAKYLFDVASTGVVGFMLQEVPVLNDSNFIELNTELKRLCSLHHANRRDANPITLEFQHWLSTSETRSGTCCLVNTSRLDIKLKPQALTSPEMKGRFACYQIRDKRFPNILFDLYNIHGHFKYQNSVADFILSCIKHRAMVCGDLNITDGSDAARKLEVALPPSQSHLLSKGRIRTIDVFYDFYSPSLSQQATQVKLSPITPVEYPISDSKLALTLVQEFASKMILAGYPCDQNGYLVGLNLKKDKVVIDYEPVNNEWQLFRRAKEKLGDLNRQKVLGISMFNKIVKGNGGMIQLHFNSDSDAATFLTNARQFFNDDKTIVARKDSPKIIRLSQEQYSILQRENEAILPKPDALPLSHK